MQKADPRGRHFPFPTGIPAVDGLIVIILRPKVITTVYIYIYHFGHVVG